MQEEIKELKKKLAEAESDRDYWMRENSNLRAKLNYLSDMVCAHTNPEDTYRDDFGGH